MSLPLLVALLAFPVDPARPQDAARMDQIVQTYVANHTFMGAVLVARGPKVVLSKGYGSADLEWNVPNAPNTKFRLGSLTKQFTAASILLLEERGKLSVNDPVKKYIPDAPAAWDKITIFHLLTHTSGIPNFTDFPDYPKLEPFPTTTEQLVARFRDKPLDFAPGDKWSYSNSGYVLLTYVLEKVTGTKYETFVQDNLFTPLGMKDSGYDSNAAVILNRASGYVAKKGQFENAGFVNMTVPAGAGGLYSTTEDLLKWEQGLFGGKLLRPASLDKMTTPYKKGESYAFGLMVDSSAGHKVIGHSGGIEGFNTHLEFYPDDKLTVVVLGNVNGSAPDAIATKMAAISHGVRLTLPSERKEVTLDAKALGRVVGAYEQAPGRYMLVTLPDKQLMAKLNVQAPMPMFAESQQMFFLKAMDVELEFTKNDAQGRPTLLIMHQGGRDQSLPRLADSTFDRLAAAALATDKRVKDQTPAPGGEAVLRRVIEEFRQGKPNYELMSPNMAAVTRQQLVNLQASIVPLGAVQSVTFTRVTPGGADVYRVKFDNGTFDWTITVGPDGTLQTAVFARAP